MYRITSYLLFLTLFLQQTRALEPVSLVLQWNHQAQFAGYYMAIEKGFYEELGIETTIINGGSDIDIFEYLETGKADFCTSMFSEAIHHNKKAQLKLLAQILNRSNFAIVAWKSSKNNSSKITTIGDLNGKSLSVWASFEAPYKALLKKEAIQTKLLPQYYNTSLFTNKGVDACAVMIYNEYHTLIQNSIPQQELRLFKLHDYGIILPEDGIYCLKEKYDKSPQMCDAFAKASMMGWDYTRQHPDESLDIVMQYVDNAHLPTNSAHMKWMLKEVLRSIYPESTDNWKAGKLSRSHFNKATQTLGLKEGLTNYKDFLSNPTQDVEN